MTPAGAVNPLPTVALRRRASHQLGCMCTVRSGSHSTAKSAVLVGSRRATDTEAAPDMTNHHSLTEVPLQKPKYCLAELCVPLVSQSNSISDPPNEMRNLTADGRATITLPRPSVT
eukprot:5568493-Prymnesium_polylepis.1